MGLFKRLLYGKTAERSRGFEIVSKEHRTLADSSIFLPIRGTRTSAGYDFFATKDLVILPQQTVKFKTDVKAYMGKDEVLLIDIRSSVGIKKDLMIANTLGVIDSDYYENVDNDGNIMIALRNLKPELKLLGSTKFLIPPENEIIVPIIKDVTVENQIVIPQGEKVAQGIFMKFLPADNCNSDVERTGGVGSTNA